MLYKCIKKAYNTFDDANKNLSKLINKPKRGKKPIRVYKCLDCGKYHLTSRPFYKNKTKNNG